MAGLFSNHRVTNLLMVVFAIVVIQKIEGYPYQWPGFFSKTNGKQPVKESSNEPDLFTSASKDYRRAAGDTVESGQTIHYAESSLTYDVVKDDSRVVDVSRRKFATGFEDDEDNISGAEEAEKDDEDLDDEGKSDDDTDDKITKLIEQAVKDGIFQTSEKWAETLADKSLEIPDDEGTSVKIQKPRSPSDPQNIVTQTTHVTTGDRIVFPDETHNKSNDFTRRPVPSCKNMTFCLETPYYPSDLDVDRALAKKYFKPITEPSTIAERIGPIDDENGLCISREEVVQPKSALDENNEWRYIVNNDKYVQTVRVEICQTQDSACGIIDGLLAGYKTSCKQKYIYRQLIAFDSNGTSPVPFQMPSSCCCHIRFTGDLLTRIGVDVARSNKQTPAPKRNTN